MKKKIILGLMVIFSVSLVSMSALAEEDLHPVKAKRGSVPVKAPLKRSQ